MLISLIGADFFPIINNHTLFDNFFHRTNAGVVRYKLVGGKLKNDDISLFTHINTADSVCPIKGGGAVDRQGDDDFFGTDIHIQRRQGDYQRAAEGLELIARR